MRTLAALDLRQIRLADRLARLFTDRLEQFLLGHRAPHTAEGAFHLAQVTDFLAERHMPNRNNYIAICNIVKNCISPVCTGLLGWRARWSLVVSRSADPDSANNPSHNSE